MPDNTPFIRSHISHMLIVCLSVVLLYVSMTGNGFVWDDQTYIVNWPEIRSTVHIPKILAGDLPGTTTGTYRPVRNLLYIASFSLWKTDPRSWHMQALLFHAVASVLVYSIVLLLTSLPPVALATAVLFALHPVHTESVAFATASMDIPGILFLLISVLLYIIFEKRHIQSALHLSLAAAALAYFSHEQTLILPLLIVLTHSYINDWLVTTPKQLKIYTYYMVPIVIYFVLRFSVLHVGIREHAGSLDYTTSLLTGMLKLVRYMFVLIFPFRLTVIQPLPLPPGSVWRPIAWLILGIFSLFVYRLPSLIKKHPHTGFFMGWFLISLLPVLNIVPTGLAYAERYLYLPSVSLIFGSVYFIYHIMKPDKKGIISAVNIRLFYGMFAGIALVLFARSYIRIGDYKNNITLWTKTSQSVPESAPVYNNLGNAYTANRQYDAAIRVLRKAVAILPANAQYRNNLGYALIASGDTEAGKKELERARSLNPKAAQSVINIATALQKEHKTQEAIDRIKNEITRNSASPELFYVLGNLELSRGNTGDAITALTQSISIDPGYTDSYNNLAVIHLSLHHPDEAVEVLHEAITQNPYDASLYYNLGSAYESAGNTQEAYKAYTKATQLQPAFEKVAQ